MKARGKTLISEHEEEGGGSISWSVKTESEYGIDRVYSNIKIRDCYKCIELDFDCYKYRHIDKRLDKLDKLIVELEKMKEALLLAEKELAPKKFYY